MTPDACLDYSRLPGGDLVADGLTDLRAGRQTAAALLVRTAAPRLRTLGIEVPGGPLERPWHRLYDLLVSEDSASAYGRYNALLRRMASFAHAAEHARAR